MNSRNFRFAESTFADFPDASAREQELRRATNVGEQGAVLRSDGTYWKPLNGRALLQRSAIPIGIAGSGTGTTAGAITFTNAYPLATFSGYLYFAANQIVASHAAGFYWTVVSATGTVATVYNNTYTVGSAPTVPTTLVPFSGAVPGAITGVTTEVSCMSVAIPADVLGVTGGVSYTTRSAHFSSANDKITRVKFGGTTVAQTTATTTSSTYISGDVTNAGVATVQNAVSNAATTAIALAAINTAAATTVTVTLQLETATDGAFLSSADVFLVG
jgi:hypothetical protein